MLLKFIVHNQELHRLENTYDLSSSLETLGNCTESSLRGDSSKQSNKPLISAIVLHKFKNNTN